MLHITRQLLLVVRQFTAFEDHPALTVDKLDGVFAASHHSPLSTRKPRRTCGADNRKATRIWLGYLDNYGLRQFWRKPDIGHVITGSAAFNATFNQIARYASVWP